MERLFSNIQQASIPVGCVPPAFVVSVGKWVGYLRGVYGTPQISYPLDALPPDALPLDALPPDALSPRYPAPWIPYPWKGPGTRDTLPPIPYLRYLTPWISYPQ